MKFAFIFLFAAISATINSCLHAADKAYGDGVIRVMSPHSVETTINRLKNILETKGMTIFKRISHSDGASSVGLELRDTELLIFGNPKVGTPLMQCEQLAAIDLPQKALAYKDATGQVWLAYNNPDYIQQRHTIKQCDKVIEKIDNALHKFINAAVSNN